MLCAFTFSSCDKNDDITVTINESGSLEMKIVDDDKNPVKNATITLIDIKTTAILAKEETNADGIIILDKILQGSYRCFISAEKEGRIYTMTTYFQIFAKDNKIVEYNPFTNAGQINVSTVITGSVKDITKYNVAVVPSNYYMDNIYMIEKYAYFSGSLGENGEVEIANIPADAQYVICIYKDNEIYAQQSFIMEKRDRDISLSFSVGSVNLHVEGEIANYNDYEVIITPYTNIANIEYIRANTLFTTKLDSKGKATISDLSKTKSYNAYLVKNDIIFDQNNFYFYNSSNLIDATLKVGSISIKIQNTIANPSNYSIALARYSVTDVASLKSQAFADGKLDANSSIKFKELPIFQSYGNSYYAYLYKDNKIEDYSTFYWSSINQTSNLYLRVYE